MKDSTPPPPTRGMDEMARRRPAGTHRMKVTLIAARVQGFEVHPCLWLPCYLLDVAAPGR